MADDRTQHALDALADLFLTGLEPVVEPARLKSAAARVPPGSGGASRPASAASSGPVPEPRQYDPRGKQDTAPPPFDHEPTDPAPAAADGGDALDGPAPIRLTPKLGPVPSISDSAADEAASDADMPPFSEAMMLPDPPLQEPARSPREERRRAMDEPLDGIDDVEHEPGPSDAPYLRLRREDVDDHAPARPPRTRAPHVDLAPHAHSDGEAVRRAEAKDASMRPRDDADDTADLPPVSVLVEAVMLGNLPGVGGPWLAQYAHLLAEQDGPVALLHVDDEGIDLEVIEPVRTRQPIVIDAEWELIEALNALVRNEQAPVRTVLVHHELSTHAKGLARLLSIDQWTFLCGADDAAVASVDRAIRDMIEHAPDAADKRVGLMVMGSDAATSRAAARRVEALAREYLRQAVQLVGWQKRMEPVRARQVGTFVGVDRLWPQVQALFGTFTPPSYVEAALPSGTGPKKIAEVAEPVDAGEYAGPSEEAAPSPAAAPSAVAAASPSMEVASESAPDVAAPDRTAEPAAPEAMPEPVTTQTPTVAPAATATPADPDLLDLIAPSSLPGGVALQARCPRHPQTQLALDQTGRLHLLRHAALPDEVSATARSGADHPGAVIALEAAIVDLLEARRWVCEHLELLALTQRQLRLDPHAQPVLHLFTPRGDLATGLVTRLGDTLKLHLLQPVRVGNQATWFCTPLS